MVRSNVVLPAPLAPRTATISPAPTSTVTSWSTSTDAVPARRHRRPQPDRAHGFAAAFPR